MLAAVALLCFLQASTAPAPGPGAQVEVENLRQLLTIKKVYIDRLGGGETAAQIRDMIIASLLATKLFLLTENQEKADAVLRGSAEDLIFTDTFQTSDGIDARASIGGATSYNSSRGSTSTRNPALNVSVGQNESERIAERKHEATASVRLVTKEGDIVWSTTQESLGGKFRGASADVADKIARQLKADYERARLLTKVEPGQE
jgi:hypothetical protein